jgi:hypothetical protein
MKRTAESNKDGFVTLTLMACVKHPVPTFSADTGGNIPGIERLESTGADGQGWAAFRWD